MKELGQGRFGYRLATLGIISVVAAAGALGQDRPQLVIQMGHSSAGVRSLDISKDGALAITAGNDNVAILWEINTARELRRFEGHKESLGKVAFSPDGVSANTCSDDGTARVWDIRSGRQIHTLQHERSSGVTDAAFSPDSGRVATAGSDGSVRMWSLSTGRELWSFKHKHWADKVLFSPEGRSILVSFSNQSVLVCDDGGRRPFWVGDPQAKRSSYAPEIAISPDGQTALIKRTNLECQLWDIDSRTKLREFQSSGDDILFSPDGKKALIGTDLWDVKTGKKLLGLAGPVHSSLGFSPDGRSILSGWYGAAVWDVESGKRLWHLEKPSGGVACGTFSPNGHWVLIGDVQDGTCTVFAAADGRILGRLGGGVVRLERASLSSDGKRVLFDGFDVPWLWDFESGSESRRLQGIALKVGEGGQTALSPDGNTLFLARGKATRIWDLRLGRELRAMKGHRGRATLAVFSMHGGMVLSGGEDATVRLWDVASGRELHRWQHGQGPGTNFYVGTFSQDDKRCLVVVEDYGSKDRIHVYDTSSGQLLVRFGGDSSPINSAEFSPDGHTVLTGGMDGFVRLWDAVTGQELKRFAGHYEGYPTSRSRSTEATFSPDGKVALATGNLAAPRLWDLTNGRTLRQVEGLRTGYRTFASFFPDGDHFLVGIEDGSARVFHADTCEEVCALVSFRDDSWAVVTPDGKFDCSRLEEMRGMHWVFSDDPLRTLSPEVFMRDHFEPRLLPRLLAGEVLPNLTRPLEKLNRVQPEIANPKAEVDAGMAKVKVRVRASGSRDSFGEGERRREMATDAYNLRLLRDGQLVWQYPDPDNDPNQDLTVRTDAQLEAWKSAYHIVPNRPDGWYETTVELRLPRNAKAGEAVRFEAYCFNEDRVKSRTATASVAMPADLEPVRPKAYVICMGVNASQTRKFDLRFAAADARDIGSRLGATLAAQDYELVPVTLVSDYAEPRYVGPIVAEDAAKENLRSVLAQLAGSKVPPEALKSLPEALRHLPQSGPDDLVVLYAAGHGYTATADGMFYLLPYDVGDHAEALRGDAQAQEAAFRVIFERSVSSSELSRWLRGVDAAQHVLILDTCMSQGAVASAQSEFKPGPFGSRGLGQLAYDKAMLVLAASQTDEFAIETDQGGVRHGLLTYALLEGMEPVEAGKLPRAADQSTGHLTLSGLLRYAADQVPEIYQAAKAGQLGTRGRTTAPKLWTPGTAKGLEERWPSLGGGAAGSRAQRPVLFDYRKARPDIILTEDTQ